MYYIHVVDLFFRGTCEHILVEVIHQGSYFHVCTSSFVTVVNVLDRKCLYYV